MQAAIKEIAGLLRSTDDMAMQFVQRVQSRVGPSVSPAEILAAMKKVPTKSLTMEKVVAKLQQQQKAVVKPRQQPVVRRPARPAAPLRPARPGNNARSAAAAAKQPQSMMDKLETILKENWDRAEAEGLQPERMSADAFINAVYQYTDRREGTRRRILQAAKQLNQADVMLAPALVADVVHELFES